MPFEQEHERERSFQAREHLAHRRRRIAPVLSLATDEMRNHLGISVSHKVGAGRLEVLA